MTRGGGDLQPARSGSSAWADRAASAFVHPGAPRPDFLAVTSPATAAVWRDPTPPDTPGHKNPDPYAVGISDASSVA